MLEFWNTCILLENVFISFSFFQCKLIYFFIIIQFRFSFEKLFDAREFFELVASSSWNTVKSFQINVSVKQSKCLSVSGGVAFLSGFGCERDLGTGSGNFFIRKFESLIFGVFFSFTWQICLFIRIWSRKICFFIRILIRNKIFRCHDKKRIKKLILRDKFWIKKLICHVNEKITPKIKFSNFRIKKFPDPVSRSLSQPFPDKKATPPYKHLSESLADMFYQKLFS